MSKTVLITGGSRGIGSVTAAYFAQKGYNVVINYNDSRDRAKAIVESMTLRGYNIIALPGDVSKSAHCTTLVQQTVNSFGSIDVLINNAGIAEQKLITDITDDDWDRMIGVNLTGVFNCCRAAVPFMINKKSGSIVNVSSMWGICGASMETHYSAAKAGVIGFTKALAKELGPSEIRVNCVAPGVIDTEMNANLSIDTFAALADETPLGRIGSPTEVARVIYFLANSADFVTGQVLSVNGGIVI